MIQRSFVSLLLLVLALSQTAPCLAQPAKGYQAKVNVSAPTRLDWTFALANKSLEKPPADWLPADYASAKQQYELFVPPTYNPKQSYPVVLFISPGDGPGGWKEWETVCKKAGIIYASPFGAGNICPTPRRVRLVLDVLDDLRRNYNTDPDRTYLTGFSGGGRIAGAIAFALPEHVGGVAPLCATGDLRNEDWLQQRLIERLSLALVTGDTDFNRGEVERYKGPWMAEIGVRSRVWVAPKLGHAVPGPAVLSEVFGWLEEGLPKRRELAKKFPDTRLAGNAAPTREERAQAMLREGKQRLEGADTTYGGLLLLIGCATRFDGLPAAAESRKICLEYDAKPVRPWEEEAANLDRRFTLGRARGLAGYATGPLPAQYAKMRPDMAKVAVQLYERLLADGQNPKAVEEAQQRLPELRKLLEK